jgi:hypothetical protein
MDAYLEEQIITDEDIEAHFIEEDEERTSEDWYYSSTSLGIGPNKAVPKRPYIVVNELPDFVHRVVEETSNARNRNFQIFVYDAVGDFTRIDAILADLRKRVKAMAPFTTEENVRCSQSTWLGVSGRIMSDGYDSCCKFASVQFTVSH